MQESPLEIWHFSYSPGVQRTTILLDLVCQPCPDAEANMSISAEFFSPHTSARICFQKSDALHLLLWWPSSGTEPSGQVSNLETKETAIKFENYSKRELINILIWNASSFSTRMLTICDLTTKKYIWEQNLSSNVGINTSNSIIGTPEGRMLPQASWTM